MTPAFDLSVYLVLDPDLCEPLGMVETAVQAVKGGTTLVQLRDKNGTTARRIEVGRALMHALDGSGVPVIINDDVDAAKAVDAHGAHVGQDDTAAAEARALLGPDKILGVSCERPELAAAIDANVVDYIGAGPVFTTATKSDHKAPIGFDGLAAIVGVSPVPTVAIGGVKHDHAAEILASGAQGLAVVSAICGRPDPCRAARVLAHAVSQGRPK
ncbi:MAG: thiamine phosphate synthase [Pseudomonadota bacterium]